MMTPQQLRLPHYPAPPVFRAPISQSNTNDYQREARYPRMIGPLQGAELTMEETSRWNMRPREQYSEAVLFPPNQTPGIRHLKNFEDVQSQEDNINLSYGQQASTSTSSLSAPRSSSQPNLVMQPQAQIQPQVSTQPQSIGAPTTLQQDQIDQERRNRLSQEAI